MICDYHVHTGYSDDSHYPMESVVRDAIRQGIDELCFTEHVDYGVKPDWDSAAGARVEDGRPVTNPCYPSYFSEVDRMREEYGDQIEIKRGLELGVQTHTEPAFERLWERWGDRLDFALLSIHQVGDHEFWNGDFQSGRTQAETNDAYYQELLDVVSSFSHYSVLAHLDLIKRYDPFGIYPFERSRDITAAILERVIADGKGIEVNTSSFRYKLPDLQPSHEVLGLYRELGGRIITIGSDSHKPEHLGAYIRPVQKRLAAMGFEGFYTFDAMEPTFHAWDFA
ncbi:MAG: histidinol-phosphatase HisJ family protein [Atopobiaceae bacterium]|jgi:histidinol-phosphatase (PHP family)|nr:histidinol-phosphatase HisJ family protein [Atopobiaceae bacterium]MCI2172783.1 histidinol-phosphatase HisJ family protein [Atopobiaceae bacterium]MCI2207090.1 histidinol-phosphatase HisJ family protein [Atopobiaceae bacterium]